MAKVPKKYAIAISLTQYDKFTQILTDINVFHTSNVIWIIFTT